MDPRKQNLKAYVPALIMSAIMLGSWIIYNLAWRIDNHAVHQALALVFGSTLFASVGFGVFIVYPLMARSGASGPARVAGAFLTPLMWMIKESALLYISFSLLECLYYLLNPLNVAVSLVVFGQMGLCEALLRALAGPEQRRASRLAFPLLVFIVGFGSAIALLSWGQGENAYVIFLETYRRLFGSGV